MPSISSKSPFPPPPEFYKLYSQAREKEERGGAKSLDTNNNNNNNNTINNTVYLSTVPPPEPPSLLSIGETYETFGQTHLDPHTLLAPELVITTTTKENELETDPTFPFQKLYEIRNLATTTDITATNTKTKKQRIVVNAKEEIKQLNKEVLNRFKQLANDLQDAPSKTNERIEEIALLFNNLHHLLNTIRPLQARTTIEFILQEQIREKTKALEKLRESLLHSSSSS